MARSRILLAGTRATFFAGALAILTPAPAQDQAFRIFTTFTGRFHCAGEWRDFQLMISPGMSLLGIADLDEDLFRRNHRSDEVPGGLVLEHQHTHQNIAGQDYRDISETIYAPVQGVEPEVGPENSQGSAPAGYVVQPGGPKQGSAAAVPAGKTPPNIQPVPGAPAAPAGGAPPRPSPAPAANAAGQRTVDRADAYQKQTQKYQGCLQQAKKDHPEGGVEFTKEFTSCIQAK